MAFCPCTKVLSLIVKALCPYGGGVLPCAAGPTALLGPARPALLGPARPALFVPAWPALLYSARSSPPFNTHVTKYIHTHSHALCVTNIHTMLLTRTTPRCIVQLYLHSTVYRLNNHTVHAVKFVHVSKDSNLSKPAVPEVSSAVEQTHSSVSCKVTNRKVIEYFYNVLSLL